MCLTDNPIIFSAATIESLCKDLGTENASHPKGPYPALIQLWDEMDTWHSAMGLYKQGQGSSYDQSWFCSLYNAPRVLRRQLKTEGRF